MQTAPLRAVAFTRPVVKSHRQFRSAPVVLRAVNVSFMV